MGVIRYNKQQTNRRGLTFTADPSQSSSDLEEINDFLAASQLLFDTYADTNLTLSGIQTINEVTGGDGVRVLVNAQSDQNENGGYVMRSGAWDRVNDSMYRGVVCVITGGSIYKDTIFIQSRPVDAPDGSSSAWFRRVDNRQVAVSSILGSAFVNSFLSSMDANGGRSALGLGDAALENVGVANGVASLNSSGIVPDEQLPPYGDGDLLAANNLSDLANAGTARTNLGLGTMATQNANNVSVTGGSITGLNALSVTDASDSQISVGVNDSASMTAINSGTMTFTTGLGNMNFNTTGGDYVFDNVDTAGRMYLFFTGASSGTNVLDITKSNGGNFIMMEYLKSGTVSSTNDEVTLNAQITSLDGTNSGGLKYKTTVTGASQSGEWQINITHSGGGKIAARFRAGEFRLFSDSTTKYVEFKYAGGAGDNAYTLTLPNNPPTFNNAVLHTTSGGTQAWSLQRSTVTVDIASIAAGAYLDVVMTVTGATTSQCAYVNRVGGFGDLIVCHCRVSNANEVTFRLYNPTGSTIDLASADIIVGLL